MGFWSLQSHQDMSQRRDARGSQSSSGTSHSASTALAQNLDAMTVVPNDETQIRAQTRSNPKARAVVQAHSNEELLARKLISFQKHLKGEWSVDRASKYAMLPRSTYYDQYNRGKLAGATASLPPIRRA